MDLNERNLETYMRMAIEAAKRAPIGLVKPHVGAVVVSESEDVISEGYRAFLDDTVLLVHAERMALDSAGEQARGSYLFSTMEPCSRITDSQLFMPCDELIVERGVHTVVYGTDEIRPRIGRCKNYLLRHGVKVIRYRSLNALIFAELMPK